MEMKWWVLFAFLAIAVYGIIAYNRLVLMKNRFKNALSQIDIQLQRRYDLIPNLVETAKGYMAHERETLEAVVFARNAAFGAAKALKEHPDGAGLMSTLAGAEGVLGGALSKLFAVMEAYPELKANQNMLALQEELSSTENRVAFARQAYNDSVMSYQTARETFPNNLYAGLFGFLPIDPWRLESTAAKEAPNVRFS